MADYQRFARGEHTDEGFGKRPYEASVTGVNPGEESVDIDSFTGPDAARIAHPMLGPNSWIRAVPEVGARIIIQTTAGDNRRAAMSYYSRMASEYIKRYDSDSGLYRPLKPGEWELMTPGVAHVYGTAEGRLYLRGGPVQHQLDPVKLRMRSRAPTYKRELHRHLDSELDNEERFGVVVRHQSPDKKNRWIKTNLEGMTDETDSGGDTKTKSFAMEYLRKFARDGTDLIDFRQGDVFDDTGKRIKQSKTNKELRHRLHVFTKGATGKLVHEVDEEGSAALITPGPQIDLEATKAAMLVKLTSLSIQATKSISLVAQTTMEVKGNTTARIAGTSGTLLGPDPAPVDAVLRGTQFNTTIMGPLLALLQSLFQGGGALAPPTFSLYQPLLTAAGAGIVPLISALPTSLSTNVKTSA